MKADVSDLKQFLDAKVDQYNRPDFIPHDPVLIPHSYKKQHDIEIAGLFAAVLAWGQRATIISKTRLLLEMMGNDPYRFLLNHKSADLKPFKFFKHRTFNGTDAIYFIKFLAQYYKKNTSLENLFLVHGKETVEQGLVNFYDAFFSLRNFPARTRKHIATPARKSACKRMNMYLRWMVRKDDKGVDFGIWKNISAAQLVAPCDVHVERVARKLNLIRQKQMNWQTALELTANLRKLDAADPVKYDFALFGLGIEEGF